MTTQTNTQPQPEEIRSKLPRGGKLILQILGFIVGIALLGWCISKAWSGDGFAKLGEAPAWAIVGLMVCTLTSILVNGATFWALIHPVVKIPMLDVQIINCVVNLLNYAPVRLGLATRLAHHRRVDRVSFFHLFAWYGSLGVLLILVLGSFLAATAIRPSVDWIWFVVLLLLVIIGGVIINRLSSTHLLTAKLRGADQMLSHGRYLSLAVLFRLIDMFAYGGRLYLALYVLGIEVTLREAVYISLICMVSALLPVGSLGFREASTAFFGSMVISSDLAGADLSNQLAAAVLIDRAAEAAAFVPLGIPACIWMLARWKKAGKETK